jgi:hypothetical protein
VTRCLETGHLLQHEDQIVSAVTVHSRDLDKLFHLHGECGPIGLACHSNGAAPSHFNDALIAQDAEGAQHGIGIDAKFCREVLRLGDPLAGSRFSVSDGTANRPRDLLVQQRWIAPVEALEAEIGFIRWWFRRLERTNENNYSSVNAHYYGIQHIA